MISPEFRSTSNTSGNAASGSPAKPANLTVGDLIIAQCVIYNTTISSVPSGFTLIRLTAYSTVRSALYYKIADAADVAASTFTFKFSASCSFVVALSVFKVNTFDSTNPIDSSNGVGMNDDNIRSPGTTVTKTYSTICIFCGGGANATVSQYQIPTDDPATWVETYDLPSNLTNDLACSMAYAVRPQNSDTGSSANATVAMFGRAIYNVGQVVVISPIEEYEAYGEIGGVIDCGDVLAYTKLEWIATLPEGTSLSFKVRSSDDLVVWTDWEYKYSTPVTSFSIAVKRYFEWVAILATSDTKVTPQVNEVVMTVAIDAS